MKINPNTREVEKTANLLIDRYNISAQLIGQMFGVEARDQANDVLKELGEDRLDRTKIARLLILKKRFFTVQRK